MAIKRKDGSIYKVRGPNKIMITQDEWDDDHVITRNFNLGQDVVEIKEDFTPIKTKPFLKEKKVEVYKPELPEKPPVEEAKVEPQKTEEKSEIKKYDKTMVFCLPAKITKYVDTLYGDEVKRLTYDKPFKFEIIISYNGDIKFNFWTNLKGVEVNSIVFVPDSRRWWRVAKVMPDTSNNGFNFECLPSDLKPEFNA